MAHTPGPWTYQATAGGHDYAVYQEATGRDVALVRDFNEENAALIAAAPDMYEALVDVLQDTATAPRHVLPLPRVTIEKIRAALIKARKDHDEEDNEEEDNDDTVITGSFE